MLFRFESNKREIAGTKAPPGRARAVYERAGGFTSVRDARPSPFPGRGEAWKRGTHS
jgi:hypothetical protein